MIKAVQHQYFRNTVANILGNCLLAGTMFVVTPLLIRLLGDTQYGLFRVALVSVVSYASLLDLGLNNAVRRFFAEAVHQNNIQQANNVLGISYRLYFILSAIVMIAISILLWWLPGWVKTPEEYVWPFRWLVLGAGVFVSGQFLLCPLRSILIALGRYDLLQISTVMARVFLFVNGIALLIFWQNSLTAMALAAITAIIMILLLTALMARLVFPAMAIKWNYRDRAFQKKIFSFGGYGLMIAIGPLVVYQTQDALISGFLGPAHVTTYAVAAIIMTQMRAMGNAFASPLFPIASKLKAQSDKKAIQDLLLVGTRRCLWAWGAIAGPLIVFAGDFITEWVGPQFYWTRVLVWILLIGNLGTMLSLCPNHILTATGSIKWLGYLQIIMAVSAIGGMLIVLGLTNWGLVGLAWVVSVAVAVRSGILVPIYACLQLHLSSWKFFSSTIFPVIILLAFGMGISWQASRWINPQGLFAILATLVFLVLINAAAGWFIISPYAKKSRFAFSIFNQGK